MLLNLVNKSFKDVKILWKGPKTKPHNNFSRRYAEGLMRQN